MPDARREGVIGAPSSTRRLLRTAPLLVVVPAVPVFFFPFRWPALTAVLMVVLPVALAWGWRASGRLLPVRGTGAPLLGLMLTAVVALVPVIDWSLSLPKALGLVLAL